MRPEPFTAAIWVISIVSHGCLGVVLTKLWSRGTIILACVIWVATVLWICQASEMRLPLSTQTRACTESTESSLRLMTFNLRQDLNQDGMDSWTAGRDRLCTRVLWEELPDVVGMQEALVHQLNSITGGQVIPETGKTKHSMADVATPYRWLGAAIGGSQIPGFEPKVQFSVSKFDSALVFNSDTVRPLTSGTFWLSETPAIVGSSFDGRIKTCTWALFESLRQSTTIPSRFFVFNTHLDHAWEQTRRVQGAALLAELERVVSSSPHSSVFVTGDFNTIRGAHVWTLFGHAGFVDAWLGAEARQSHGIATTFHNFWGSSMEHIWWRVPQTLLFTFMTVGTWREVLAWPFMCLQALVALTRGADHSPLHLDWVLLRSGTAPEVDSHKQSLRVVRAVIVTTSEGPRYASDHHMVLAQIMQA